MSVTDMLYYCPPGIEFLCTRTNTSPSPKMAAQRALLPTYLHAAARLGDTLRLSAASTSVAMKQHDEHAVDAVSSRKHNHGEDAEAAMAAAHHFDKARSWLSLLQMQAARWTECPECPHRRPSIQQEAVTEVEIGDENGTTEYGVTRR